MPRPAARPHAGTAGCCVVTGTTDPAGLCSPQLCAPRTPAVSCQRGRCTRSPAAVGPPPPGLFGGGKVPFSHAPCTGPHPSLCALCPRAPEGDQARPRPHRAAYTAPARWDGVPAPPRSAGWGCCLGLAPRGPPAAPALSPAPRHAGRGTAPSLCGGWAALSLSHPHRGTGSLVGTVVTRSPQESRAAALGTAQPRAPGRPPHPTAAGGRGGIWWLRAQIPLLLSRTLLSALVLRAQQPAGAAQPQPGTAVPAAPARDQRPKVGLLLRPGVPGSPCSPWVTDTCSGHARVATPVPPPRSRCPPAHLAAPCGSVSPRQSRACSAKGQGARARSHGHGRQQGMERGPLPPPRRSHPRHGSRARRGFLDTATSEAATKNILLPPLSDLKTTGSRG